MYVVYHTKSSSKPYIRMNVKASITQNKLMSQQQLNKINEKDFIF
jgi:hypothetical protein